MSNVTLQDRLDNGLITIDEFRALNGNMSKSSLYEAVRAGKIPLVKQGRKSLVPGLAAKLLLTEIAEAQ